MAITKVRGFMLSLKWGGKLIQGLETSGLKIKPNFEEILLKANNGVSTEEIIDYDVDLSFAGKTYEDDSLATESFETLRVAASQGAEVAFVYGRFVSGEKIVSGTGQLTDYSEDGNSKDTGSFSGSIKAKKGSVTFTTY